MSLAQEIVAALPAMMEAHPKGPRVKEIAPFVAAPEANVRRAIETIKAEALAIVVRYPGSKARHVVPLGHKFARLTTANGFRRKVCAWCDTLFQNGSRKFCSKECFARHMWSNPERREKGSAAAKRVAQTPTGRANTAKLVARQQSPEGRQWMSERNRKDWADPTHKAKRSASLQAALGTPEKRKFFSESRKADWEKPGYRERASESMRRVRAEPEVKAKYSAASKRRWQDPAYREKMAKHSHKLADLCAERFAQKKQDPEHVAKRIAARKAKAAERGYWRRPTDKKYEK